MKRNTYFIILLIAATFISCKKDKIEYVDEFKRSFNAWIDFKKASENSYSYTVITSSWTGFSSETTLTVVNGQITGRSYILKGFKNNNPNIVVLEQWEEDTNSLNTHDRGAALLTLDEIYNLVKNDLLLKRPNAETSFEAKNEGLISSAGYVEHGCQDDCFIGISIKSITKWP